jgi:ferric enterobactin receptor
MKGTRYNLYLLTIYTMLLITHASAFAGVAKDSTRFLQKKSTAQTTPKAGLLISGRVKDATTGEPLPNVTVRIAGASGVTSTNMDGYFTLRNVPSDTSTVIFTMMGFKPLRYRLSGAKSLRNLEISITASNESLNEVVINIKKEEGFKLNQKPGLITLTPAAIATLPNLGEKDIFRSLQLMPGISSGNEQSSGLYVRGGTPDQNLVLYDGFTVYNVDHLFGFFSAFNANAIKDVQLYKGTAEAKYGGRLSSVVDITGKEGNKKTFNASIDLSLLSINAFIESPIGKKASILMAYRRSYKTPLYNKIAAKITGQSEDDFSGSSTPNGPSGGPVGPGNGPPPRMPGTAGIKSYFDDLNLKFTYNPSQKDVIGWSYYTGKDKLDKSISSSGGGGGPIGGGGGPFNANTKDETEWGNTGTSLKWSRKWTPTLFSNTLVSYSKYFSSRTNTRQVMRDSATTAIAGIIEDNKLVDVSIKSDLEWNLTGNHLLGFGYQLTSNDIKYKYALSDTAAIIDRHTKGKTFSIYLQDKITLLNDKLVLTPGIRASYFGPTSSYYPEPRFSVNYSLTENVKLKSAVGRYYQFAKRVVREDVLQGSRDFWVLSDNDRLPVSSSTQYLVGLSWENNNYLFDIEAYAKTLKGLLEYTLRFEPRIGQGGESYKEHFYEGTGNAKGIDVLAQKKFGNYKGWVGYTIGEVTNNFPVYGKTNFYASNDIRHEFKMVHMYKVNKFDFSVSWVYLTGKPYTAPSGGYYVTLLDGTKQRYLVVTGKNQLRLPAYHRLDIAATYNYGKIGKTNGSIGLSFFNAYNRTNIWYKNFEIEDGEIIETNVNYLKFAPNLTFTIKLK